MTHNAQIKWNKKATENFIDNTYSRVHNWLFDGGYQLKASASPNIVRPPMSDASLIDPEEAFIAAISSCHMLFFLSIAAKKRYIVTTYSDKAIAKLGKINNGNMAITALELNPKITFDETTIPNSKQLEKLHDLAHQQCFLANSTTASITINI